MTFEVVPTTTFKRGKAKGMQSELKAGMRGRQRRRRRRAVEGEGSAALGADDNREAVSTRRP